ncbi:hypothetical protein MTP99_008989 [Tenebrio molitor]|nr:hypothetical protein MTP99_008989 [Tenebrio molitor]
MAFFAIFPSCERAKPRTSISNPPPPALPLPPPPPRRGTRVDIAELAGASHVLRAHRRRLPLRRARSNGGSFTMQNIWMCGFLLAPYDG